MADIRRKLDRVVRLHAQTNSAFRLLESHVKAGLLESEDIFASLSVPLLRLVGHKSMEMTEEGRSCTIVASENAYTDVANCGAGAESETRRITQMEERRFNELVSFLRTTESAVNSHLEAIYQRLTDRRSSLHRSHQAVVAQLGKASSPPATGTLLLAVHAQRATFRSFEAALMSLAEDVELAVCRMAEEFCHPLVGFVKQMKADRMADAAGCLLETVHRMESVVVRRELEEARKRVRDRENENRLVRKRLALCEEEVKRLRKKVETPDNGLVRTFNHLPAESRQVRAGPSADQIQNEPSIHMLNRYQILEDDLLWELLKNSREQANLLMSQKKFIDLPRSHPRHTHMAIGKDKEVHDANNVRPPEVKVAVARDARSSKVRQQTPTPSVKSTIAIGRPVTRSYSRGLIHPSPSVAAKLRHFRQL